MSSLNLSANGPAINASYQKVANAGLPAGAAAASPTYGQWAVYSVQAPLISAFQQSGSQESVLKVQTTGEGELADMIEDFSDGRIQFAFVKVKDPNTSLPKSVLVGWCGEGVPERTKGYFTSHLNAVAKVLHGYHIQITARSDRDLTPESIVQKIADSSGSKYSGGGNVAASRPPPPAAAKPVLPTKSFGNVGILQPLNARTRAPAAPTSTDNDGWGNDAPAVTRSQLEKVDSAYKPTKVNIAELQAQSQPSRYQPPAPVSNGPDVVSGGYQPIGKVDIDAIRRDAQASGTLKDDRPSIVKGAYEPVGRVDLDEIRKKSQAAPPPAARPSLNENDEQPKSLAERSSAFTNSERLTSMPKPKVSNQFGSSTSTFAGTKAPAPAGFGAKPLAAAAPVGTASKTFADEGGKTPAQLWAERKAAVGGAPSTSAAQPVAPQTSGGWSSGYEGKKWGVQMPSRTGGSGVSEQRTGPDVTDEPTHESVGSVKDRFSEPPPLDTASKPNAGGKAVPMPGLPSRPSGVPAAEHQELPPPPPRPMPADEPEEEDDIPQGEGSPVRIAMPVARDPSPKPLEPAIHEAAPGMPTRSLAKVASQTEPEPEPQTTEELPSRGAAMATAGPPVPTSSEGHEAVAQYDYEKAEENELELHEGEKIINIEMVDEDWWMGENSRGERGLFPSNYVELASTSAAGAVAREVPPEPTPAPAPAAGPAGGSQSAPTALALYDYEAAEDNELSFTEGAQITDVEFPDEDWWSGRLGSKVGLFPSNYVQLQE